MGPRSILFTLYGDYIRPYGGEASVGSLTRLMEEFGFSSTAVRAAIFRMARQGWLSSRRLGRQSFYSLTRRGARRLAAGARRIYKVRPDTWEGRWHILAYSIQESQRRSRDDLRQELGWLGFGPLAPGVWLSPWDLREQVEDLIEQRRLGRSVNYFLAELQGFGAIDDLVRRCWDLGSIAAGYERFLREWGPKAIALRSGLGPDGLPDNACFRERILLVHEWRKFLFVDPHLPAELLPPDWAGTRAAQLFDDLYQALSERATRFFEAQFRPVPDHAARVGSP